MLGSSIQMGVPNTLSSTAVDLRNNVYITTRNAADTADINMIKVNASDLVEFGVNLAAFTLGGAADINNQPLSNLATLNFTDTAALRTGTSADDYYNFEAYNTSASNRTSMEAIRIQNNAGTPAKMGFYGATPVVQQSHIADPTESIAANNTAIDAILVQLAALGLQASS